MARTRAAFVHNSIKRRLGYRVTEADADVLKDWKRRTARVCKPCWELRYCPYGPLVERSPLLPLTRAQHAGHIEYLQRCLSRGHLDDGTRLTRSLRLQFQQEVTRFRPNPYPESIPTIIAESACTQFGHVCPVFFSAEGFTETSRMRRQGRYIPFRTKMRVVRRDNYTCQHCGVHLKDSEVEFDHIIPVAKGGSSEEHNIRLTCHDCNSDKSDMVTI